MQHSGTGTQAAGKLYEGSIERIRIFQKSGVPSVEHLHLSARNSLDSRSACLPCDDAIPLCPGKQARHLERSRGGSKICLGSTKTHPGVSHHGGGLAAGGHDTRALLGGRGARQHQSVVKCEGPLEPSRPRAPAVKNQTIAPIARRATNVRGASGRDRGACDFVAFLVVRSAVKVHPSLRVGELRRTGSVDMPPREGQLS